MQIQNIFACNKISENIFNLPQVYGMSIKKRQILPTIIFQWYEICNDRRFNRSENFSLMLWQNYEILFSDKKNSSLAQVVCACPIDICRGKGLTLTGESLDIRFQKQLLHRRYWSEVKVIWMKRWVASGVQRCQPNGSISLWRDFSGLEKRWDFQCRRTFFERKGFLPLSPMFRKNRKKLFLSYFSFFCYYCGVWFISTIG